MEDMKDINGFPLKVGDTVKTNVGTGRIVKYLGPDTDGKGARVTIQSSHKVDIALFLAHARYQAPTDPNQRTTTAKYGM